MTSQWFSALMLSASPLLCGDFLFFTNKQYIFINTSKGGPSTLGRQRDHKLRSMCTRQKMRLSPERQVLNRAGRRAFSPSHPAEPAGFSAPGCLVYFYKRCLSSECWWSCNFGSSIRLCVCLSVALLGRKEVVVADR